MPEMEFDSFGTMLKHLIKISKMSQTKFYTELGITKPYFYDIVSGKVNPPPPKIQFRIVKILNLMDDNKKKFFEMAGQERNEVPADIAYYIKQNPSISQEIRKKIDYSTLFISGGN